MAADTDLLRQLSRLNVAKRYAEVVELASPQLEQCGTDELLIVIDAAYMLADTQTLADTIRVLERGLGSETIEVLEARLQYALLKKDNALARGLLQGLETWNNLNPWLAPELARLMLRRHDWSGMRALCHAYITRRRRPELQTLMSGLEAVILFRERRYFEARLKAGRARRNCPEDMYPVWATLEARCRELAQDPRKAAEMYEALLEARPASASLCYRAARVALSAGRRAFAVRLIDQAEELGATGYGVEKLRAFILLDGGDNGRAEIRFEELAEDYPWDSDVAVGWVCAAARHRSPEAALRVADDRLAHVNMPGLLARRVEAMRLLGRREAAEEALREALDQFPHDDDLLQLREHEVVLLNRAPTRVAHDDEPAGNVDDRASGVVLTMPPGTQAVSVPSDPSMGQRNESMEMFRPRWTASDLQQGGSFWEALSTQIRVLYLLIIRETHTRFARTRLGFFWVFLEPLIHIAVFYGIWSFRGRETMLDMPLIMFLITGFIPFFIFRHTFQGVQGKTRGGGKALLSHRNVNAYDLMISTAVVEGLKLVVVFFVLLLGLILYGMDVTLYDPLLLFVCFGFFWILGIGLGLLVDSIASIFATITVVTRFLMRFLYFTSGVIIPVRMFPQEVIDILLWNPLLHLVSMTRTSFVQVSPMEGVNLTYPAIFALMLLAFGMISFRALYRRMLAQ